MKKWICKVGFYLMAVYPEDLQRTLNEFIEDGLLLDKDILINSIISIQEYESCFIITFDNKYSIGAIKRHYIDIDEE